MNLHLALRITLTIALFNLLHPTESIGCSCKGISIGWEYCHSDVVLTGKVISKQESWAKFEGKLAFSENPNPTICNVSTDGYKSEADSSHFCIPIDIYLIKCSKPYKGIKTGDSIYIYSKPQSNCYKSLDIGSENVFFLTSIPKMDIYGTKLNSYINQCSLIHESSRNDIGSLFLDYVSEDSTCEEIFEIESEFIKKNWISISKKLDFKVDTNKIFTYNSTEYTFPVYLEEFGPSNGVIFCDQYIYPKELINQLYEEGYFILNNFNLSTNASEIEILKHRLSSLGYFGNQTLDWYNNELKEFTR